MISSTRTRQPQGQQHSMGKRTSHTTKKTNETTQQSKNRGRPTSTRNTTSKMLPMTPKMPMVSVSLDECKPVRLQVSDQAWTVRTLEPKYL